MNGYPSFYPRIALVAPSPGKLLKNLEPSIKIMLVKQMATIGELLTTATANVFHDILTHWSPGYLNDILDKPFQSNFNE